MYVLNIIPGRRSQGTSAHTSGYRLHRGPSFKWRHASKMVNRKVKVRFRLRPQLSNRVTWGMTAPGDKTVPFL